MMKTIHFMSMREVAYQTESGNTILQKLQVSIPLDDIEKSSTIDEVKAKLVAKITKDYKLSAFLVGDIFLNKDQNDPLQGRFPHTVAKPGEYIYFQIRTLTPEQQEKIQHLRTVSQKIAETKGKLSLTLITEQQLEKDLAELKKQSSALKKELSNLVAEAKKSLPTQQTKIAIPPNILRKQSIFQEKTSMSMSTQLNLNNVEPISVNC